MKYEITADITNAGSNLKNCGHIRDKKEIISGYKIIDSSKPGEYGDSHELIDCRLYMGRSNQASVVYCIIWVHCPDKGLYFSGSGQAGGYGYDRQSGAVADAIDNTGITLSKSINGAGSEAIRAALQAIAKQIGVKKPILVEFYA